MNIINLYDDLVELHTLITSINLMEIAPGCEVATPQAVASERKVQICFSLLPQNRSELSAPNRPSSAAMTSGKPARRSST
jgi:hypothetical protein